MRVLLVLRARLLGCSETGAIQVQDLQDRISQRALDTARHLKGSACAWALLAALCVFLAKPGHAQSPAAAPSTSPMSGVDVLRGDFGSQDRFDPDAAKDSERARQLLRSLLAEDMARATGRDGNPNSGAAAGAAAGSGPSAASPGRATPPAVNSGAVQSQAASSIGFSQPASGQNVPESAASGNSASGNTEVPAANRAVEGNGEATDSPRFTSTAPVDGSRTRALVASLLSEIAPYVITVFLLYLGYLALKAKLKRDARKSDRSGRSGRRRREASQSGLSERDAEPAMVRQRAGNASAARN
ncbi:MAG: hypothetical protein ACKVQQ_03380 [Burkholderiales bacterium]